MYSALTIRIGSYSISFVFKNISLEMDGGTSHPKNRIMISSDGRWHHTPLQKLNQMRGLKNIAAASTRQ